MIPAKHHRHQTDVPANITSLAPAREAFRRYLSDSGVDGDDIERWTLVFTEAFTNAVRHGGKGRADAGTVRVEWWQDPEQREAVLEMENVGAGPTATEAEDASLPGDQRAEGGRGMFMIRELADRVEHWRCGDRYRLVVACSHDYLVPDTGIDGNLQMALEELENTYEHLAAFHALGNSLITSRPVADVIREGLAGLADAQTSRPDLVRIGISDEAILPELAEKLLAIPEVVEEGTLPPPAKALIHGAPTLVWGESDGSLDDPTLAPFRSGCCLPIVAGDVTLGVLLVGRHDGRSEMPSSEIGHYRTFADLFAITLANANLLLVRDRQKSELREFEIATEIQRAVLSIPAPPTSDRFELFLKRRSAADVAGDYVEATLDPEGRIVMSIVDVMGKGVPAAILASLFRTALHSHLQRCPDLPELVESINRTLCRQIGEMTMFLTCLVARFDPRSGELEVINAGHCPLILMRESGGSEEILPTGSPLGLFPDDAFPAEKHPFDDGDSLVMVTDGLYEWEADGQPWGWEALANLALADRESGQRLWDHLQKKIGRLGSPVTGDDQTLLHFKMHAPAPCPEEEAPTDPSPEDDAAPESDPVFARRSL